MRRAYGFTLVEVMVSIGLISVGALGTLALLRQSSRGNRQARQIAVATQIAENWIERLRVDAMEWPLPANGDALQAATADHTARNLAVEEQLLANTQWLNLVSDHAGSLGPFQTIPINSNPLVGSGPDISNGFDETGRDVLLGGDAPHAYCASFRLSWLRWPRALRADVRVWWPRAGSGIGPNTLPFRLCQDTNMGVNELSRYHTVYLSSVISATRLQH